MQRTPIIPADCTNIVIVDSIDELLTREFNETVNCFVLLRDLSTKMMPLHKELFNIFNAQMAGSYDHADLNMEFKPSEAWLRGKLSDDAQRGLDILNSDRDDLSAHYNRFKFKLKSLGKTKNKTYGAPYIPHHDYHVSGERLIANYGASLTHTSADENFEHVMADIFKLKSGAKAFGFGNGSMIRFATNGPKTLNSGIKPWKHWGTLDPHRIMLEVY